MPWILLFCAGLLEIGWALGLKHTVGLTRLWPSVATLTCMAASVYLLALAVRELPVGTAYAVWTGIGAVGTVVVGILFFREPYSLARVVCLALIVAGIAGLKLSTPPDTGALPAEGAGTNHFAP